MTNKTTICNMALARIRHNRRVIDADSDTSEEAKMFRVFYDSARDFVLREHPWGFAKAVKALSATTNGPPVGWSFEYDYPSDCLFLRAVTGDLGVRSFYGGQVYGDREFYGVYSPRIPYEVMSRSDADTTVIVCDISPAYAHYTKRVENTERFDSSFVNALAWYLASELAPALKSDKNDAEKAYQMFRTTIMQASASTQNERKPDKEPDSPSISIRD